MFRVERGDDSEEREVFFGINNEEDAAVLGLADPKPAFGEKGGVVGVFKAVGILQGVDDFVERDGVFLLYFTVFVFVPNVAKIHAVVLVEGLDRQKYIQEWKPAQVL